MRSGKNSFGPCLKLWTGEITVLQELAPAIISIACLAVAFLYAFVSDSHRPHPSASLSCNVVTKITVQPEPDEQLS